MTQQEAEEFKDLYWEVVSRMIDGIEAEIIAGTLSDQLDAELQLHDNVECNEWIRNPLLACHVLLESKYACEGLGTINLPSLAAPGSLFPFWFYARMAMQADCQEDLKSRAAYAKLPRGKMRIMKKS